MLLQAPPHSTAALLGDIVATRYKVRGIKGVIVNGRSRDVVGCGKLCQDGAFQCWSKGLSSAGTSLEAKPWAVDVPVTVRARENFRGVVVHPGDVFVGEAGEGVCCVIPREKVEELGKLLPELREADEGVLSGELFGFGVDEIVC